MTGTEKRNRYYISQENLHNIFTSIEDSELGESIYQVVQQELSPRRDYYGYASGTIYIYANSAIAILKNKVPVQKDGLKPMLIDRIYNSASNSLKPFRPKKRIYEEDEEE